MSPSTLGKFPVVYRNLQQIITTLKTSEIGKSTEVKMLLKICSSNHPLLDPSYEPKLRPMSVIKPKMPFLVMEGLDGSGKTKVSTALSEQLNLDRLVTPPESVKFLKDFFDEQRESVRRAYYSLSNYIVAQEVANSKGLKGIILDRYWYSTACYAVAQRSAFPEADNNAELPPDWFYWPDDLLKPDLVLFLVVSEKIRQYRHAFRNTTNTKEEKALANNTIFRQSLLDSYRKIQGVTFVEIDADPDVEIITKNILNLILEKFPAIKKN